ncbi:MAG: extracellular solute-binding protein, partial [Acetatifactor sp.]|nr:extracellular solute-binding protein [Acetatifactor sp.]
SWIDCDINGHAVDALSTGADGGLVAFLRDGSSGGSYLVFLRKVEAAALPQKTQIVIGCIGSNSELQAEAAAFNRQSSNCHVTIRNYAEGNNGLPEDGQDPSAVLGMAIATGIDCPDILSLEELELYQMDIEAFTGNGAFEDQTPFLERSSILTPEDYPENVLDSFRYQGVLAGIPYNLALRTVVGRASDVGNENGWTLDEMMAYAAEHPQQELFSGAVRDDILYDCLAFNQNLFIDWESGQCHFDSEEFKRLLLFAAAFPAEYDYGADERSVPRKIQDGDVLLYKAYMDNFYVVQEHETMFGEPITYIGYPAADSSGCLLKCGGALAISAQSQNKEAAWEFIEYHLSREADKNMSGFPARSSMLEQQMQEATTVSYYVDEQGEPLLDADGKPVPQSLGGVQWSFADEEIIFRTATKEEVLQVKKLIETSRTAPTSNDTVLMIIQEEAEPFFLGQKPVENVMGIIQHRVQIYMDERS